MDLQARIDEHKKHVITKTMTVDDFSKEYNIGKISAYRMTRIEGFPCIRLGRKVLIIRSEVDNWINNNFGLIV